MCVCVRVRVRACACACVCGRNVCISKESGGKNAASLC